MAGSSLDYPLSIYVPAEGTIHTIDPGSGIVGSPAAEWFRNTAGEGGIDTERLVIDYEGNRYDAVNMVTFADRCLHAAGRHREHYPTVARLWVPEREFLRIGEFDGENVIVPTWGQRALLARWIGAKSPDFGEPLERELLVTGARAVA